MKQAHDNNAFDPMPLKIIIAFLAATLALAAACTAQKDPGEPEVPAESLRPVIYPPEDLLEFPQDQMIKKALQVTTQWQTVTFEKPLEINRGEGRMGLQLVVDLASYIPPLVDHPLNSKCYTIECIRNSYGLRRLSDGTLIKIEAVLVGDKGEQIRIQPIGYLYPYFDPSVMFVILGYTKKANLSYLPFPEGIQTFTHMRIHSTEPFFVRYLWWSVYDHPELILNEAEPR